MAACEALFRIGAKVLLAVLSVACLPSAEGQPTISQPTTRYGQPVAVCEIHDPRLTEASGLVASRRNPGYYYTHNDSQGQPWVYVLDRLGRICTTIRLVGARNVDWEDISLARGDQANTYDVCVADIGDNKACRTEIVIYRFPEPEINALARGRGTIDLTPKATRCKYEDGPRDAEGFATHPQTGDGYLFTKQYDGVCRIYRLAAPWPTNGPATLKCSGTLKFPKEAHRLSRIVTAADISPDGRCLVTRGYVGGWEWRLPEKPALGEFARIVDRAPTPIELAGEPQGEALCFSADGSALLTISEQTPTTLYEVRTWQGERASKP